MMMNVRARIGQWSAVALVAAVYLFLYLPIIVLTVFSFNKDAFPAPWTGFTWRWYGELWESTYLWEAFGTSCIVAVSATALSLLMGVLLLFYLMQYGRVTRVMNLFYANLIIPEVVLAVGLLGLFSWLEIELGLRTLIIAHTVLGLGYVIPVVYQKYRAIDPQLVDASLDLGATMGQTFRKVVLPLLLPSLYAAGLLTFIISFDDFILSCFCSGGDAQTLSLYMISMLRTGISPVVNALSTLLLAVSSVLVLLFCYWNVRSRVF